MYYWQTCIDLLRMKCEKVKIEYEIRSSSHGIYLCREEIIYDMKKAPRCVDNSELLYVMGGRI